MHVSGNWAANMVVVSPGDEEDAKEIFGPGCHAAEKSVIAVHARQTTAMKTDHALPRHISRVTNRFANLCQGLRMFCG